MAQFATENFIGGTWKRLLQGLARGAPGARSLRVMLHRWRGVKIGEGVWIGYDVILETAFPHLLTLGHRVEISPRVMIIAHMRELRGVTIEDDVVLGAGVIVLPNVTIGRGSVIAAGSVVTTSIPPMTVAQGNPAKPVAKVGITFGPEVTVKAFSLRLKRLENAAPPKPAAPASS
jgi:serine acetyltransferase